MTDYFAIGGLASAMLNAGVCDGLLFVYDRPSGNSPCFNTLSGYFLVVAHCFYGLNLLNMMPCFLAPFVYLHRQRLDYKDNLHICMYTTSFAPFISEFLFRYTQRDTFLFGQAQLELKGVILAVCFCLMMGYVTPLLYFAGARHGIRAALSNGGLAFRSFGTRLT